MTKRGLSLDTSKRRTSLLVVAIISVMTLAAPTSAASDQPTPIGHSSITAIDTLGSPFDSVNTYGRSWS